MLIWPSLEIVDFTILQMISLPPSWREHWPPTGKVCRRSRCIILQFSAISCCFAFCYVLWTQNYTDVCTTCCLMSMIYARAKRHMRLNCRCKSRPPGNLPAPQCHKWVVWIPLRPGRLMCPSAWSAMCCYQNEYASSVTEWVRSVSPDYSSYVAYSCNSRKNIQTARQLRNAVYSNFFYN